MLVSQCTRLKYRKAEETGVCGHHKSLPTPYKPEAGIELKAELGCTKRQQQQKEIKKKEIKKGKKEGRKQNKDGACTLCRLNDFAVRFAVDQKDHF